jgi:hypothetical protein
MCARNLFDEFWLIEPLRSRCDRRYGCRAAEHRSVLGILKAREGAGDMLRRARPQGSRASVEVAYTANDGSRRSASASVRNGRPS